MTPDEEAEQERLRRRNAWLRRAYSLLHRRRRACQWVIRDVDRARRNAKAQRDEFERQVTELSIQGMGFEGQCHDLEDECGRLRATIDRLHETTGLALSKAGEVTIERDALQAKLTELHHIPWRLVVLRARRVLAMLSAPPDQTMSSHEFALAVEALREALIAYDANLEVEESDDYSDMGRDELLARARDWRQVANDRSAEIVRLGMQREIVDAALRDAVAERDRQQPVVNATLELVDAKIEGETEREAEAWITLGGALALIGSVFDVSDRERAVLDDPELLASIERGMADAAAGRVRPWSELTHKLDEEPNIDHLRAEAAENAAAGEDHD